MLSKGQIRYLSHNVYHQRAHSLSKEALIEEAFADPAFSPVKIEMKSGAASYWFTYVIPATEHATSVEVALNGLESIHRRSWEERLPVPSSIPEVRDMWIAFQNLCRTASVPESEEYDDVRMHTSWQGNVGYAMDAFNRAWERAHEKLNELVAQKARKNASQVPDD